MFRNLTCAGALCALTAVLLACGDDSDKPNAEDNDIDVASCDADKPTSRQVCLDGELVSCSSAGSGHCQTCGCSVARDTCDMQTGMCKWVPAALQAACKTHDDCESKNCGVPAGAPAKSATVCLQTLGAACSDSDCSLCKSDGTNSYCTRGCDESGAPIKLESNGKQFLCIINLDTNRARYLPACATTQDVCLLSTQKCFGEQSGRAIVCDDKQEQGQRCITKSDCKDSLICSTASGTCQPIGANGAACKVGSECTSGLCGSGTCKVTLDNNDACTDASQCKSGLCASGKCLAAGLAAGAACTSTEQCKAAFTPDNQCVNQICRAPSGFRCTTSNQCQSNCCEYELGFCQVRTGSISCK